MQRPHPTNPVHLPLTPPSRPSYPSPKSPSFIDLRLNSQPQNRHKRGRHTRTTLPATKTPLNVDGTPLNHTPGHKNHQKRGRFPCSDAEKPYRNFASRPASGEMGRFSCSDAEKPCKDFASRPASGEMGRFPCSDAEKPCKNFASRPANPWRRQQKTAPFTVPHDVWLKFRFYSAFFSFTFTSFSLRMSAQSTTASSKVLAFFSTTIVFPGMLT